MEKSELDELLADANGVTVTSTELPNQSELEELGFTKAAGKVDLTKKIAIAYEHYRAVTPTIFARFQKALKEKTMKVVEACPKCKNMPIVKDHCGYCQKTGARIQTHDKLVFMHLSEYANVPPKEVLGKLREAKALNIFDEFEVAKVETVEERPDPIIFGIIKGVPEKFCIAQWDNDVKIEDILEAHEG